MVAAQCGRSVPGCHLMTASTPWRRLVASERPGIMALLDEVPLLRTLVAGFLHRDVGRGDTLLADGAIVAAPAAGPLGAIAYRSAAGLVIPVGRALGPADAAACLTALAATGPLVLLGAAEHVGPLIAAASESHSVAFDLTQQVMEREGLLGAPLAATTSLQVRLAQPADLERVVALVADHQREELGLELDRSLSGGLARRLRERIERRWCVLGYLGDEPVTHVAASVCSPAGAQLEAVYTVPTARGYGYAATALATLGSELAGQGAPRLTLVVAPGNEAACRLYTRLGLTIRGHVRFVRLVPRGAGLGRTG
jgi:ribosomal protein S18 acetylase RimI-like enzyme